MKFPDTKSVLISNLILFILSAASCLMLMIRIRVTGQADYLYLVWNLFLAWIPLILALIISYRPKRSAGGKLSSIWLGLLWLIFYPNAPYMLTDFIHIRRGETLLIWYDFIIFSLFIVTAFLVGFLALYLVHKLVCRAADSRLLGWLFALFVQLLSGFGVYLGRVQRWNSWDALFSPIVLLNGVLDSLHYKPLIFSLLFGTFLILTYTAVYSLTSLNISKSWPK